MGNAANILNTNKFKLLHQDLSGTKLFPKYKYSMSCSRIVNNAFFNSAVSLTVLRVILELDATRLSDKYPIKPIHDFVYIDPKKRNALDRFEHEDRILSKTPIIENAKRYIKCINWYRPKSVDPEYTQISNSIPEARYSVSDTYDIFKNSGVPTYIYDGVTDFYMLDKRKAELL